MSNGFPGGRINAITQTPDGYLWIGTNRGLVRFDGFAFLPVGRPDHLTPPVSQALSLVAGKDGALWLWDQDMNVRRYIHGRLDDAIYLPEAERGVVSAIARSREGDLLVATQAPRIFRNRHGRSEPLTGSRDLGIPAPQTVAQSSDGRIWMATYEAGLFYWDGYRVSALKEGVPEKINCLLPVENGKVWIGTDEGVYLWDGHRIVPKVSQRALQGARVLALAQDRDANLWVGTSNGLFRLNPGGIRLMEDAHQGSSTTITALFEDGEGDLWIGDAQGLERLQDGRFTSFRLGKGSAPDDAVVGPVYADALNRAWVGTSDGGMFCILNDEAVPIESRDLQQDAIYSITGFKNDLWVGRREGGLTHLVQSQGVRPAAHTVRTYTQSQGLAQNSVSSVFRSSDGTIWAGTLNSGLSYLRHGRFRTLTSADGLGSNTISTIQEGRDGAMWFGTSDGLTRYANGKLKTFRARDGLPADEVTTLFVDASGVVWVGTSQGLAYVALGEIHPVLDSHPALHEPIFGIAQDGRGYLWLTTSNHVLRIQRSALVRESIKDGDYQEFGEDDGLRGTEGVRRDRSAVTDVEGRVWLSTLRGLSRVRPTPRDVALAPPHVESVSSDGKQVDPYGVVRIGPDPQRIVITYEAVSLAHPNQVRYRYKLLGFDQVWSEPTESRQVIYTNLSPGSYSFGIQTSRGDSRWQGSEEVLTFNIQPTLRQTWWFRLLCSVSLALSFWAFYVYRLRLATMRIQERLNARLEERERIARELHDTLLQGLQGLVLRFQGVFKAMPQGSGRDLMAGALQRADDVMIDARQSVKDLRMTGREDDFQDLLKRCGNDLADGSSSQFSMVVFADTRALHPAVLQDTYKIVREALINAFQHSQATKIEIELTYLATLFVVVVRDDGIGVSEAILQRGRADHWGIMGMRERAKRIGAELTILSRVGSGTEVRFALSAKTTYADGQKPAFWSKLRTKSRQ